ncbi:hypothetical protein AWN76_007865 [Rhodothermaceae bacterium RA]|nr:hypothetical protein AWN76_007865 [Rhodothermaceae bacterium RA]
MLLLQTPRGARTARDAALRFVNERLLTGATLEVGRIDGTFLTRLTLTDVRLVRGDSVLARLDSASASYRLLPLLRRQIHVRDVALVRPTVHLTQQPDSTWDLADILPATTDEPDTTSAGFRLRVDRARLVNGVATARFYAPGRDSVFRADGLHLRLHDLRLDDTPAARLDSLWGRFQPPGSPDSVSFGLGAHLTEDGRFTLHGLHLTSARSRVSGRGSLHLPEADTAAVEAIDFTLQAAPLAFRDIHAFAPMLDPAAALTLDIRLRGSGLQVTADADATLSDGGRVSLQATATPTRADTLVYRLALQVRDLDPGRFVADTPALAGTLNLDARADLHGASLHDLQGPFQATVTDTRLGDYALARTTLEGQFEDGTARLNLTSGLRQARLALDGTLQPFATPPAADLTATFADVDLGRLLDDPARNSDLAGQVRVQGRDLRPDSLRLDATLTLAPSTLAATSLPGGHLALQVAGEALTFDGRLDVGTGQAAVRGSAVLAEVPRYRIAEGRLTDLDAAALAGDTTRSRLSGTFSLDGSGTDPATMTLTARLSLQDSHYGPYRLIAGDLRAALRNGRLETTLGADLEGGTVRAHATARPFAPQPTFAVTEGRFEHLDIGTLAGLPDQRSDLSGRFALRGTGLEPATLSLDAEVTLTRSQLNAQPIDGARLAATLQQGTLTFDTALDLPEGRTRLAGTATPFADVPTYALREGRLEHLDLGALAGRPDWRTDLNATIALEGTGLDPASMSLTARIDLDASAINQETIQRGFTEARLDDGFARLDARLDLPDGLAELQATGRFFDDRPRYEAQGLFRNLDLARLSGVDTLDARLSARFDVAGAGLTLPTMRLHGNFLVRDTHVQGIRVDTLRTAFDLADGLARIDTVVVHSNVVTLQGGGPIALTDSLGERTSNFRFAATLDNLAPLEPLVGAEYLALGEGTVTGRVFGRPGTLRLDVRTALNSLAYNDLRLAGFEAVVLAEFDRHRTLRLAEVQGDLRYASVPALTIENTAFEASYADETVRFMTEMVVDKRRDARLQGRVELNPERRRVVLDSLRLRFDDDRWTLLQEASIAYGDAYRISNLLLYAGDQQIALDGVVDFDGRQSLILTIEQFRIGAVADLLDFQGLDGTLNGYLDLSGAATAPTLGGALNLDLASYDREVGTLALNLAYDSLLMDVDARLRHRDGSRLTLEGTVPMDLRLTEADAAARRGQGVAIATDIATAGTLNLALRSDSFAIGWVRPFLDPTVVDRLEGTLSAEVDITGTLDSPTLSGFARLQDGVLGLPELGTEYRAVQARATLDGDRIVLEEARLRSSRPGRLRAGDGRLSASGTINLPDLTLGAFDLTAEARDFLAINTSDYRAVLDGRFTLQGTTEEPVLEGNVTVLSADIYLTDETSSDAYEEVTLTEADLQMLERRFGVRVTEEDTTTFDFYEALSMALSVRLERDIWLRSTENPEMYIQFTGDLDVQKAPYGEEQAFGSIEVIPERSVIRQFGKEFSITSGTLTFNGPVTDPLLDIDAEYRVPSRENPGDPVIITLSVEGRLDNLDIEPGSENPPNMELTDIVSYLVFGRPASESFLLGGSGAGGNQNVGEIGVGIALGQVAALLESTLGQELGLDVIEIEQDGLRGTKITAGSYYSIRGLPNPVFLAISQPISFSSSNATETGSGSAIQQTEVTIEYELAEGLLARISRRRSIRFNLIWKTAY